MTIRPPRRPQATGADVSGVFPRSIHATPPVAVRGDGATLVDAEGRRYLDACGGAAVSCLGHGHPEVARAMAEQAARMEYAHTGFFTSQPAEALAKRVADSCPGDLERVYLVDSGSEAVETALKMARQYHLERGEPGRTRIVSRRQSYHGNTLGALAVSGSPSRREPYAPMLLETSLITPCFFYREARTGETPQAYGRRAADALEEELQRLGPQTVMAFVAETVVGATAGAVPPAPGYLARVREICDRHGVLLILDEVMCGAWRCGPFLACEDERVVPDIVTLAKGLGGGYAPIGAVVCTARVFDAFAQGSGAFRHGFTYSAHPVVCAAALAVQQVIAEEKLQARVPIAGERLRAGLQARIGGRGYVGDIRGRGLLLAVELVTDRASKTPFDPALALNAAVKAEAFARGLLVYPGGGTADGRAGDHVLLAPPYTVTDGEVDMIVDRLAHALDAAVAGVTPAAAGAAA